LHRKLLCIMKKKNSNYNKNITVTLLYLDILGAFAASLRSTYYVRFVRPSVNIKHYENGWTDFHEIWCEHYAIEGYPKLVLFNALHSLTPMWRILKFVRWEVGAPQWCHCPWLFASLVTHLIIIIITPDDCFNRKELNTLNIFYFPWLPKYNQYSSRISSDKGQIIANAPKCYAVRTFGNMFNNEVVL
jgi:hypothetical protein